VSKSGVQSAVKVGAKVYVVAVFLQASLTPLQFAQTVEDDSLEIRSSLPGSFFALNLAIRQRTLPVHAAVAAREPCPHV